jgi:hypothetical protein
MGDAVSLHGPQIDLASDLGRELIVDLSRFYEELLSEAAIRKKYRFDDKTWEQLGSDDKLVEMVEDEKIRRIRDGSAKREKAQQLVVKAPGVLGDIMNDPDANPRHRIDSAKALDDFAANGPGAAAAGARFVIHIDLGGDHVESYSKSIAVNAEDEDPYNPTPPEVLAAITAKKKAEGGGGGGDYL